MAATLDMNLARRIDAWLGTGISLVLYGWARLRGRVPRMRATTPPLAGPLAPPRRILAMKFYGLGNVAMLLPVLAALREACPRAEIHFLTMASNRELVERASVCDRVLSLDVSGFRPLAATLWRLLGQLRAHDYDLVIDFEQFIKLSAILAFLSGAPERVGFNTDGQRRGWLFTRRVVYTDSEHQSRIFLRVLKPLGVEPRLVPVAVPDTDEERKSVDALLREAGGVPDGAALVTMHVGSGVNFYRIPVKRWPIERFASLADRLVGRHDAVVVFTGKGETERGLVAQARAGMEERSVDLCDRLSVGELLALLRRSTLTVTNDTSVMHLSALVGTPTAAFFGPSNPLHYGPNGRDDLVFYRDLYCSPCLTNYSLKVSYCESPICMRSIGTDEVFEAIERRFFATRRGAPEGAAGAGGRHSKR